MFFEINKSLCETYTGLDPIKLLDYPAEDVMDLISGLIDFNSRSDNKNNSSGVIRKRAGDDWF